ncbi:hypothetical protein [Acrocarpospora catenulata]|uniref:hypothetical protein n=1 Tax=Acrocarpospora catenulata TaxID=2836182 RepID=UPI001BDAB84C|nr:hypothetical protein [Acrocarpospora catenulata]
MTDTPVEPAWPRRRPSVPGLHLGQLFGVAVTTWSLEFFAWLGSTSIELKECGLDPLTEYETDLCAPASFWSSTAFILWMAKPLAWAVAALFLWRSPQRWTRRRRLTAWSIPGFPMISIMAHVIVVLLYA